MECRDSSDYALEVTAITDCTFDEDKWNIELKEIPDCFDWDWFTKGMKMSKHWKRNKEASTRTIIDLVLLSILDCDCNSRPLFVYSELTNEISNDTIYQLKSRADYVITHTEDDKWINAPQHGLIVIQSKSANEELKAQDYLQTKTECAILCKRRMKKSKKMTYGILTNSHHWVCYRVKDTVIEKTKRYDVDSNYLCGEMTVEKIKESWGTVIKLIYSLVIESFKNEVE